MKVAEKISLRMRITLWTGVMLLVVSLILSLAALSLGEPFLDLHAVAGRAGDGTEVVNYTLRSETEGSSPASRMLEASETSHLQKERQELSRQLGFFLAITILLGMVFSYFIAGWLLAPLRKLSQAVAQISASSFDRRLSEESQKGEVGELAASLNQMLDRMEETIEWQRRFSANVAHELKTPLAMLKMGRQMACKDREPTGEEAQRLLAKTERNVDRFLEVVDGLFALTNEEGLPLNDEIEIGSMLKETADTLSACYREKGVRTELALEDASLSIKGDAGLVRQAFHNLVENAMKYSEPGGQVRLAAIKKPETLEIVVSDDGPGIPEEHIAHIFEPFYCVDPCRSIKLGGTGLGLSIVKKIIERHGWEIRVESKPGEGTSFTVIVPLSEC